MILFLIAHLDLLLIVLLPHLVTGESGKVLGIEADPAVAFITGRGLRSFPSESEQLVEAMSSDRSRSVGCSCIFE